MGDMLIVFACLFGFASFANASTSSGVTYHGRVMNPDGTPLAGANVQFKIEVRSPGNESCLLYSEVQTLNLLGANGIFSLTLNDGSGTRVDTSSIAFDSVFSNRQNFSFASGQCAVGTTYNPNSGDGRSLIVSFRNENMAAFESLPAQPLNFAPIALQAKAIEGYGAGNLLKFDDSVLTANASPLNNTQYNALLALINGTSTQYMKSSTTGGGALPVVSSAPSGAGAGSIWFDSTTHTIKYNDGTTTQTVGSGAGSGTVTSITAGAGLSGGTITTSGTISLPTVGTANSYYKVTTDAYGRVSSGATTLVESDIPNLTTAGHVSGDTITSGTIGGSTVINTTGTIYGASVGGKTIYVYNTAGSHKLAITAPALTTDYSFIFPDSAGASGNVLSTDGAGHLSWITAGGAPTGTAGGDLTGTYPNPGVKAVRGVTVSATTPTAAGQTLRYDGSSSYVPGYILGADVRSSMAGNASFFPAACGASQALTYSSITDTLTCATISASGLSGILPVANGGTGTATGSITGTGALTFAAGGTNQNVALTPSGTGSTLLGGSVGIGTVSPSVALDVVGSVKSSVGFTIASFGQILGATSDLIVRPVNNFRVQNLAGSTEYMTVLSSGNVGIGTASPGARLELSSGTANTSGLKFSNFTSSAPTTAGQPVGVDASGNLVTVAVSGSGTVNSGTANQIAYYSANGSAVSGLTSTASSVLTTNGSGVPAWSLLTNDSFTQYALLAGRAGGQSLEGGTAASENLTLDSTANSTKGSVLLAPGGGNVGIGTTSASTLFDARGSNGGDLAMKMTNTNSAGRSLIDVRNDAGAFGQFVVAGSTYSISALQNSAILSSQNDLNFLPDASTATSGTHKVSITTGGYSNSPTMVVTAGNPGKVGFGTTSPGARVEISSGTANTSGLKFTNFTSTAPTTAGTAVGVDASGNLVTIAASGSGTVNSGTANQLAYYSASGAAVGGLTSTASSVLTTNGSGVPAWSLATNDNFTQYALLAGRAGGQSLSGGTAASENLTLDSTANATKGFVLLAPSGGKVGVGTASPAYPLQLNTTGTATANGTTDRGGYFVTSANPGAVSQAGAYGMTGVVDYSSSFNATGVSGQFAGVSGVGRWSSAATGAYLNGMYGVAMANNASGTVNRAVGVFGDSYSNVVGGTITSGYGLYGWGRDATGTVTNAYGVGGMGEHDTSGTMTNVVGGQFSTSNTSTGTITNAYGVSIAAPVNSGGGTIGAYYGLYLQTPTAATTNYAIYSTGGTNYFGGNVGIGSTSPATKLQVAGSVMLGNGGETCGATYYGAIRYNSPNMELCTTGGWAALGTASGASQWTTNAPNIYYATGNVGIGTTSPSSPLHAAASYTTTSGSSDTALVSTTLAPTAASSLSVSGLHSQMSTATTNNTTGAIYGLWSDVSTTGPGTASNLTGLRNDVYQNHSSATASNMFGVYNNVAAVNGTSSAIYGTYNYSRNANSGTAANLYGEYNWVRNVTGGTATHGYGSVSLIENDGAGSISTAYGYLALTPINPSGTITNYYGLYVQDPGATATNPYAIYSAGGKNFFGGNTGIGTNSPTARLEVSSGVSNTSGLKFTNFTSTAPTGTGQPVGVDSSGNLITVAVSGSGTVNSGTANQLAYYSASGTAVGGLTSANSSVLTTNSSGVPAWSALTTDNFTQYALLAGRAGGQTLKGGTAASETLTLDSTASATKGAISLAPSGGNVAIGNATAGTLLDVQKSSTAQGIGGAPTIRLMNTNATQGDNGATGYNVAIVRAVAGNGAVVGQMVSNYDSVNGNFVALASTTSHAVSLAPSNSIALTAAVGGNVGIGTMSPNQQLQVVGSGDTYLQVGPSTASNATATLQFTGKSGGVAVSSYVGAGQDGGLLYQSGTNAHQFRASGGTVEMQINASGLVGIGTASPISALHVQGTSTNSAINVTKGSDGVSQSFWDYTASYLKMGTAANDSIALLTNNTERIRIDKSGTVGIGTTSPNATFDVVGYSRTANSNSANIGMQGAYMMWNYATGTGETDFVNSKGGGGGGFYFYNNASSTTLGTTAIATINASGTYTATSDARLKREITPIEKPLEKVLSLNGYTYYWKQTDRPQTRQLGVIAQEVQKVFPEVVDKDPKSGFFSVGYDHLVAALIAATKEFHQLWSKDSAELHRELASVKEDLAKAKSEAAAKDKELAAMKAYLCAKDPKASICH